MIKKKILIFSGFYLPGFKGGGPIRSIANMVDALNSDFDFYIVCGDRDLGSSAPYHCAGTGSWVDVNGAKVLYFRSDNLSFLKVLYIFRNVSPDLIYVNSFFSYRYSIVPMIVWFFSSFSSVPFLLAPRGEFSPGALKLKHLKKSVYIYLINALSVHSKIYWHFSNMMEMEHFSNKFPIKGNYIAGNIPARLSVASDISRRVPEVILPPREETAFLKVVFLSRISRKKNLKFAIDVLVQSRIPVHFFVAGPIEDEMYWGECMNSLKNCSTVKFEYVGVVDNENVVEFLGGMDLFFFPTLGENYGHVFAEAFSAGLPVLTSDQTPWRNLEKSGVGWDIPLGDVEGFVRGIIFISKLSSSDKISMREKCRRYAISVSEQDNGVAATRSMFLSILSSK